MNLGEREYHSVRRSDKGIMLAYSFWQRRLEQGLALAMILGVTAGSAHAQGTRVITGIVRDTSGVPIPYVSIRLDARLVATDDSGRFQLQVDRTKRVTLQVRRIGFTPTDVRVEAGTDTTVTLALIPLTQTLPGRTVAGANVYRSLELHGFYRRLREKETGINAGHFISVDDIEQRKPTRVTHLFDGLGGVRMARTSFGSSACLIPNSDCIAPVGPNNCPMTVYLNGTRLNPVRESNSFAHGIDDMIGWSAVAGIEIYSSAGRIPPEYQRLSGTCGAILIWTK